MRILLTNDDGIHAPGLFALQEALREGNDLHIVAPETEMSAVGHAITLNHPIRVRAVKKAGAFYGHAITGTPADCVKIGVKELLETAPDVILSGINLGRNVGMDILYSGTVSAATEGAFLGFPSAAISLDTRVDPDFSFAARLSREIVRFLRDRGLMDGTALNVNVPAVPEEEISGVSVVRQGTCRFDEGFERRCDPRGNNYYWLSGEMIVDNGREETDFSALRRKRVTLTPIQYDLTSEKELQRLRAAPPSLSDV